jgi:hypothetical protein
MHVRDAAPFFARAFSVDPVAGPLWQHYQDAEGAHFYFILFY